MAAVFQSVPGTLVVLRRNTAEDDEPVSGIVMLEGLNDQDLHDVIIVSMDYSEEVMAKVTATIGGPEYLFVFGDRLSGITVNALLFTGLGCDGPSQNGVMTLLRYYRENRLQVGRAAPIRIVYASAVIRGFLMGLKTRTVVDASGLQATTATMQLIGWVDESSIARDATSEAPLAG